MSIAAGKNRVKVSVIMPARNVEDFITQAIRSVLRQRCGAFELLIGDDASTDRTWERILPYQDHPRVRAVRFRSHLGRSAARNRLIARARGKYLSICDADDKMLAGNLRVSSRLLERSPGVGVVCCDWRLIDRQGRLLPRRRRVIPSDQTWDLMNVGATHGGSMIRRRLFRRVGGYREDLLYAHDLDLLLRLAEVTRFARASKKPLYQVRFYPHLSARFYRIARAEHPNVVRDAVRRRYGVAVGW